MKRTGAEHGALISDGAEAHGLIIDSLAYGGDGVARWDGRVVFIPCALPGDVVSARIVQDKGTYLRAAIERIEEPSPDRIEPFCPLATSARCRAELSYLRAPGSRHRENQSGSRGLASPVGGCFARRRVRRSPVPSAVVTAVRDGILGAQSSILCVFSWWRIRIV